MLPPVKPVRAKRTRKQREQRRLPEQSNTLAECWPRPQGEIMSKCKCETPDAEWSGSPNYDGDAANEWVCDDCGRVIPVVQPKEKV